MYQIVREAVLAMNINYSLEDRVTLQLFTI